MRENGAADLEDILLAVHDRWFDLDAVTFDTEARSVTIPFWGKPTRRFPRDEEGRPKPFDHEMRIRGVSSYRVDDRERIGFYSFNKVEPGDKTLTITADPHVTITLEGEDLSVARQPLVQRGANSLRYSP